MATILREGTAEEAGLSAEGLDNMRELAAGWVKDGVHPALVVLVARHGVIALDEAFGRLGPEAGDPLLPRDALFPLASLSKAVTATVAMTLVDEGRLGLTRPVREYLPEFDGEGREEVQVHHLMTHTSGLRGPDTMTEVAAEVGARLARPPRDPALHPVLDAFLQIAYDRVPRTPPGEEMFYHSDNYELLGEIVRRVGGRPLPELYGERVFGPLGMHDTSLALPEDREARFVRAVPECDDAMIWAAELKAETFPFAASGVCSTARDMAVFGQMFLNGGAYGDTRILSRASTDQMLRNQIPGIAGSMFDERHREASWSFGWGIGCDEKWKYFPTHVPGTFSHGGGSGVYLWGDPSNDLIGAYFSAATKPAATPGYLLWAADLFVNAVMAAVVDRDDG